MSQNDFNLANQGFPSMRGDMNSAFQALATNSSGPSEPSTTYAYQWWYDDANDILKFRNGDNDAWIDFASFNQATDSWFIPSVDINGGTIDGTVIGGTTAAAISGTTGSFSNDVTLPSINGGPLAGFRNAIINGNFDHWQRGTSFTASDYGADRWINGRNGTAATQSQQEFTLGQTDVPNEPEYFARTVVSSVAGAGNFSILDQRIEDVRTFAGKTITVSFFAKADAAKNIAVEFEQIFGSGGTPSAPVNAIGVATISLTTTFQKFTVTATIPSIAGKTLGTSGNDSLKLLFWFDSGSDFNARNNSLGHQSGTFDIAQVQLEAGSVATPFERRPVGTELALCQRYFEVGFTGVWQDNAFDAGHDFRVGISLIEQKIFAPTITLSAISRVNTSGGVAQDATVNVFTLLYSSVGDGAAQFRANYAADSEL